MAARALTEKRIRDLKAGPKTAILWDTEVTGLGLRVTDSASELRARIELPDTQDGKDVRELVRLGVLRGLSAEFRTVRDQWQGSERTIHEAQLVGLAVVDQPAYLGAGIEAREAVEWLKAGQLRARSGEARLWPLL